MDRKLDAVGHRVETQPGCGLISDITHAAPGRGEGGKIGAAAKGRAALQAVLKEATAAVGNGIHDRANEVTAYARREPVGALTVATGVGFLVGLCLAIGSHATTGEERSAVPAEFKTELSRSTHGVGLAEAPATGVSNAESHAAGRGELAGAGATTWVWECGGAIRAGPVHRRGPRGERSSAVCCHSDPGRPRCSDAPAQGATRHVRQDASR